MKKIIILYLGALMFSSSGFSQEDTVDSVKTNYNEIKLNGLILVVGAFEVTYERTITEESGVGLSIFLPFSSDISDDLNYYISPYYRFYFGKKYAAGFFLEGFGMLNSQNIRPSTDFFSFEPLPDSIEVTDFALGIGLGGKWVTKSGFIGELSFGFGRNLFEEYDNTNGSEFVGKVGITAGYRF